MKIKQKFKKAMSFLLSTIMIMMICFGSDFGTLTVHAIGYSIGESDGFSLDSENKVSATFTITEKLGTGTMQGWLLCLFREKPSVNASTGKLKNSGDIHPYSYSNCAYYFCSPDTENAIGTRTALWSGTALDEKGSGKTLGEVIKEEDWHIVIGPRYYYTGWGASGIGEGTDGIWENGDYYVGQASKKIGGYDEPQKTTLTITLDRTNYADGYVDLYTYDNEGRNVANTEDNNATITMPEGGKVRVFADSEFTVTAEGATISEMIDAGEEGYYYEITNFTKDTTIVVNKGIAGGGDNFIDTVDVNFDWQEVPLLVNGSRELPSFSEVTATVTVDGAEFDGIRWGIKITDSLKVTEEDDYYNEALATVGAEDINAYNSRISHYGEVYGWAPLEMVLSNPYYKINENDVYAAYVVIVAEDEKYFGTSSGDEYLGNLTCNVEVGCKLIDGDGEALVVFFELGTLAEIEQEKNEAGGTQEDAETHEHSWSDKWTVIKNATATQEGKEETTCLVDGCGQKKVRVIPVIGETDEVGNLQKDAEVEKEAPIEQATLNNKKSALLAANIFTPEEKADIENNGAGARVWLEIGKTNEAAIDSQDKAKIEQEATKIMGNSSNITYFDADLYKQVGAGIKTPIEEPGVDIEITIKIPAALINSNNSRVRQYQIIRLHYGEVEVIPGTFNSATNEFTFKSNKFSTYAIAYADTPIVGTGIGLGGIGGHIHSYKYSFNKDGHWENCICGASTSLQKHSLNAQGVCKCGYDKNSTTSSTPVVNPSTGGSNITFYLFVVMLLTGLGIALCSVKKQVQK